MRNIAKAAVESNGRYGLIGLHQLLYGIIKPVLNYGFHKCFAGYFFKILTKGISGHVGDGSSPVQRYLLPKILDQISKNRVNTLLLGNRALGYYLFMIKQ